MSTDRAGVRRWAVALGSASCAALVAGVWPPVAGTAASLPRVRPEATATAVTDDDLGLEPAHGRSRGGHDRRRERDDRVPRTTGLIGWPNYGMNCYYVRDVEDHHARRAVCVDGWEDPGPFGHGGHDLNRPIHGDTR